MALATFTADRSRTSLPVVEWGGYRVKREGASAAQHCTVATDLSCDSTTPSTSVLNCSSVTNVVSPSFQIITCAPDREVESMRFRMHVRWEGVRAACWAVARHRPSDNVPCFLAAAGYCHPPPPQYTCSKRPRHHGGTSADPGIPASQPPRRNDGGWQQGRPGRLYALQCGRAQTREPHSDDVDSIRTIRDPEVTAGGPA